MAIKLALNIFVIRNRDGGTVVAAAATTAVTANVTGNAAVSIADK